MSSFAIAVLVAEAVAAADPPPCRVETEPAARAVCVAHAADALVAGMEAELVAAAGRLAAVAPATAEALLREAGQPQAAWRRAMEAGCPLAPLPRARCRLAEAEARAEAIARRIARAAARHGAPYAGYDPRLEVTPLPGGGYRVAPAIDLPAP